MKLHRLVLASALVAIVVAPAVSAQPVSCTPPDCYVIGYNETVNVVADAPAIPHDDGTRRGKGKVERWNPRMSIQGGQGARNTDGNAYIDRASEIVSGGTCITHPFGEQRGSNRHSGVDLRCNGNVVRAPVGGYIEFIDKGACGKGVRIRYAQNRWVLMCHLKSANTSFKPGQWVNPGVPIGVCGQSGSAQGPHLDLKDCTGTNAASYDNCVDPLDVPDQNDVSPCKS